MRNLAQKGGYNSLNTPVLVKIVDRRRFRNASGIMNLFRGIGFMLGPYAIGNSQAKIFKAAIDNRLFLKATCRIILM
jgi:hypothetical protein